jgi:signal peptidase I
MGKLLDGRRRGRGKRPERRRSVLREITSVVVVALVLSWLLKTFLVQAFFIPSESMMDTLVMGDRILVNKLAPGVRDLHRGDVVVFRDPGGWLPDAAEAGEDGSVRGGVRRAVEFVGLAPADTGHDLVKRIIGVGGDRVVCCDAEGRVSVNGTPLEESYLFPGDAPSEVPFDVKVRDGSLWVMGDHRGFSEDSRAHLADERGGMVPLDNVIGRAFVLVWPVNRAERLERPATFGQPALEAGTAR